MDGNITIEDMVEKFIKIRKEYKEEIRVKRLLELCVDNVKEVSINNSPMDIIEDVIANKSGKYSSVLNLFVESFSPGGYDAEQLTILTKENNIMKEVNKMKTINEIKTPKDVVDFYEELKVKAESIGFPIRYDTHNTPLDLYYHEDYDNVLVDKSSIREHHKALNIHEIPKFTINDTFNISSEIFNALTTGKFTATVDSNSRLILTTEPNYVPTGTVEFAYENVDFVTLHKDDAKTVVECVEEAIVKIGGDKATDVEVFGEKSISFERLYDRTIGLLYHQVKK